MKWQPLKEKGRGESSQKAPARLGFTVCYFHTSLKIMIQSIYHTGNTALGLRRWGRDERRLGCICSNERAMTVNKPCWYVSQRYRRLRLRTSWHSPFPVSVPVSFHPTKNYTTLNNDPNRNRCWYSGVIDHFSALTRSNPKTCWKKDLHNSISASVNGRLDRLHLVHPKLW